MYFSLTENMLMLICLAIAAGLVDGVLITPGKGDVGRLPAMGFNSWNSYGCNISENTFLSAAEHMVKLGLRVSESTPCHA
jgi:alpha-galactosidase